MNMCTVQSIKDATTISNHYTAQVNHDMYAGGW